jgi:hypothetical protein
LRRAAPNPGARTVEEIKDFAKLIQASLGNMWLWPDSPKTDSAKSDAALLRRLISQSRLSAAAVED